MGTVLSAYARALDGERELTVADDYAARAAAQADRLFRFGRVDFLDVLTAEGKLADAHAALAQSQASLADAQVQLLQDPGEKWQEARSPQRRHRRIGNARDLPWRVTGDRAQREASSPAGVSARALP